MLTDIQILTVGLLLFAELLFFALGVKVAGVFGVFSGLFGAFLAIELWDLTGDMVLASAYGTVAIVMALVSISGWYE